MRGFGVNEPGKETSVGNLAAHEMGHAFGLEHDESDDDNLMYPTPDWGDYETELTREQCKAIWLGLERFKG